MNHPNRSKVKDVAWPGVLRDYRLKHGYTPKTLADALQITKRQVENWEAGVTLPPAFLFKALKWLEHEKRTAHIG